MTETAVRSVRGRDRTGARRKKMNKHGTLYLLHFIDPVTLEHARYEHAGHYQGWTDNLPRRLHQHRSCGVHSSPLVRAALESGLDFVVADTLPGTRDDERKLKNRGGASRRCPICRGDALPEVIAA